MTLVVDSLETRQGLLIGLIEVAFHDGDFHAADRFRLEAMISEARAQRLTPLQTVRVLCLEAVLHWVLRQDPDRACRCWRDALAVPAAGDRLIALEQFMAAAALVAVQANRLGQREEAKEVANALLPLAQEYDLEMFLLSAYLNVSFCLSPRQRLDVSMLTYTSIPNRVFTLAPALSLESFVQELIRRAFVQENYRFVLLAIERLLSSSASVNLTREVRLAGLIALGRLARFQEATDLFQRIRHLPGDARWRQGLNLAWAEVLIRSGRHEEAEAFLSLTAPEPGNPLHHSEMLLLRAYQQTARGLPADLGDLEGVLRTPSGSLLWERHAPILRGLGCCGIPPLFHLQALGPLTLGEPGAAPPHWSRKKALSLLAFLCLHPEGIASERLAEKLFDDAAVLEPVQMLHTAAHSLRQALRKVGGEDLLESTRGVYRLNWQRIAFCDLHEFNLLDEKARSLAAEQSPAAALFHELSLLLVQGALFANLPDEFDAQREELAERVRHARAYLLANARNPLIFFR